MDSEKTVTSIRLNNDSVIFLVLEWEKDKKLNLTILNIEEKEAYEGQATEFDLRSQAAKIRMSFSDFMLKTRDALFKKSSNQTNYLYSLDKTNENYVFKWKSIDSEETIISLGSLEVEKMNFYSFLTQFLFSFTDEMQSMKLCIENLNSELNACKSQLSTALTNLSSAIDLKKGMEKELYSKFILLLNEKKHKIKELENNHDISSPITKKKKMPPTKMLASSDESDTELENNANTSSRLNMKKKNPPTNTVASYESNLKLDNISNTSLQLNKKKKNHFLNMLVSSSESDVDGEFHNEDPGPSNQRMNNSLQFDDEPKLVPQTQIRKRKVAPQKNSLPDPSSRSADKDNVSDDGSVDTLMELL